MAQYPEQKHVDCAAAAAAADGRAPETLPRPERKEEKHMTRASKQGIPESDANVSWVRSFVSQGRVILESVTQRGGAAVLRVAVSPRVHGGVT